MKKNTLLLIFVALFISQSKAQDTTYVRNVMNTIGSAEYNGRGYGLGGHTMAAKYISAELKRFGLKQFKKSYFQDFNISVNTFTEENNVSIDNTKLVPAQDFLIAGFSNTTKGKFKIVVLNAKIIKHKRRYRKFLKKDFSKTFVLIDTIGLGKPSFKTSYNSICQNNTLKARGIIQIAEQKLTHSPSQWQQNFCLLTILRKQLPQGAKNITLNIYAHYFEQLKTQNIAGYVKGRSDSFIVFSAHYDHLGNMGKSVYFPGGNDNSSGTAMLLDLAKHFSAQKNIPKYNILFLFFSGEELGILGSQYFTENPLFPLSKIKFLTNLDMIGSGDIGIQVVNGSVFSPEFEFLTKTNEEKKYLPEVRIRGAAANSDHYFFYVKGVRCFFIYTLGEYSEYHNIYDHPQSVPLIGYNGLFRLLNDFSKYLEQ